MQLLGDTKPLLLIGYRPTDGRLDPCSLVVGSLTITAISWFSMHACDEYTSPAAGFSPALNCCCSKDMQTVVWWSSEVLKGVYSYSVWHAKCVDFLLHLDLVYKLFVHVCTVFKIIRQSDATPTFGELQVKLNKISDAKYYKTELDKLHNITKQLLYSIKYK